MMIVRGAAVNAIRAKVGKGQYRRDIRADGPWVGHLIGRQLNFDTETKAGQQRARTLLRQLIEDGVLRVELKRLRGYHNRKVVVVPGPYEANPRAVFVGFRRVPSYRVKMARNLARTPSYSS